MNHWAGIVLVSLPLIWACSSTDSNSDGSDGDGEGDGDGETGGRNGDGDGDTGGRNGDGDGDTGGMGDSPPLAADDGWPGEANEYSWDGSWTPTEELEGLYDAIYFDGHNVEGSPSPILPPGEWDWEVTSELATWNGFSQQVGTFDLLSDDDALAFGWRLDRAVEEGVEVDAVMEYFHGSSGTDIIDLGPDSSISSTGNPSYGDVVGFGDGPDMLRYRSGYSAAIRLGSSAAGAQQDNDLALVGGNEGAATDTYNVITTAIHGGPGSDLVFVSNFERAAVDLGNGNDGRTDTLDPQDSADIVVIGRNARDFRVFGGRGDDTFVWLVDEVKVVAESWLGPNFFGGGGWGDALWSDEGTDRLVLGIPEDTLVVSRPGDVVPGSLLIMVESAQEAVIDTPTEDDLYARYYVYAPASDEGRRTVTVQYLSADESVNTAYFYLTAVEEIQVGTSASAPVYLVDDTDGSYRHDDQLKPLSPIPSRAQYEALMDSFLR